MADETVFESSYDSFTAPTRLNMPMPIPSPNGMIRGWTEAVKGMQIGGVRELSVPSDYGYGDGSMKFLVMLVPYSDEDYAAIRAYHDLNY